MQSIEEPGITWDKNTLREYMIARRRSYVASFSEDRKDSFSVQITRRLMDYFTIPLECIIGTYYPLEDELSVRMLNFTLMGEGLVLSYPRVCDGGDLTYHVVASPKELIEGAYGILEPQETAPQVLPDLFLTPLVAFDASCHRLGYGKGYYDRALKNARETRKVLAIGVAYDMQKVGSIPFEPFDQQLDYVVTESQVFKAEKK